MRKVLKCPWVAEVSSSGGFCCCPKWSLFYFYNFFKVYLLDWRHVAHVHGFPTRCAWVTEGFVIFVPLHCSPWLHNSPFFSMTVAVTFVVHTLHNSWPLSTCFPFSARFMPLSNQKGLIFWWLSPCSIILHFFVQLERFDLSGGIVAFHYL